MPPRIRDIIKMLEDDGWRLVRFEGTSHRQYRHPHKPGTVTVAGAPGQEIGKGTLSSIRRQAGLRDR